MRNPTRRRYPLRPVDPRRPAGAWVQTEPDRCPAGHRLGHDAVIRGWTSCPTGASCCPAGHLTWRCLVPGCPRPLVVDPPHRGGPLAAR